MEPVSRVQQTVTPQLGQKWWLIRVPALLVRVYIVFGPYRRTASLGKYALLVHGTPDRRWQSRQWHTLTTIGSAETTTLKAPHRHLAVLGMFVVSRDWVVDPVRLKWAVVRRIALSLASLERHPNPAILVKCWVTIRPIRLQGWLGAATGRRGRKTRKTWHPLCVYVCSGVYGPGLANVASQAR